jgi:hypothetical protein
LAVGDVKRMVYDLMEIKQKYESANKYFPDPIEYLDWLRHKLIPEMERLEAEFKSRVRNGIPLFDKLPWK